ncbi:hypothetical protein IFM47457_05529 [Aspergillus lentulus]|nr:hypothetical protein IFM47457_05529 [Aspergillus lentulus]
MGLEQAIADVPHDERVAELFTPYLGVRFVKDDNNYLWAPDTESELLWFGVRVLLCDTNVDWFEWEDEAFDDKEEGIPQLDSNGQPTGNMLTIEEVYEDFFGDDSRPFWVRFHKRYVFMVKYSDNNSRTSPDEKSMAGSTSYRHDES